MRVHQSGRRSLAGDLVASIASRQRTSTFHDGGQGSKSHLRQDASSGDGVVDLAMALRCSVVRLRCWACRRSRMPEVYEVP
jgi:hypothetical protein